MTRLTNYTSKELDKIERKIIERTVRDMGGTPDFATMLVVFPQRFLMCRRLERIRFERARKEREQ